MASRLVYGVDLGINNVGWAAVRKDEGNVEILAMGTFVFESPLSDENKPEDGLKSKARGNFRRARRTARRRSHRKRTLYRLLAEHGLLPPTLVERVEVQCNLDPHSLRKEGLERALEPFEFGRVLCHLNQRRGFLSPRDLMIMDPSSMALTSIEADLSGVDEDATEEKKEEGRIQTEIQRTRDMLEGYMTVGAFLAKRVAEGKPVRKRSVAAEWKRHGHKGNPPKAVEAEWNEARFARWDRHMIKQEFDELWRAQAPHHPILTPQLKERVERIIFSQRLLQADQSTRGKCIFYPKEARMPRASLTAQKFVIAQEVAHLEVFSEDTASMRKLTPEERVRLVEALMERPEVGWSEARELLGLPETALFDREPIPSGRGGKKPSQSGKKDALRGSQTVKRIRAILGTKWDALDAQRQRELVGEIVSIRDWTSDPPNQPPAALRRRRLFETKYGLNSKEANALATIDLPEGYLNIGIRAAKRIMKHLLRDKVYSEACAACGFDHANPEGTQAVLDRLPFPSDKDIPNRLVLTSVRSAVRVLNALHKEFGKPDAIHIELPRDLAKGAKQREEDEKKLNKAAKERAEIAKELVKIGVAPTRDAIRKVQLWRELGGAALAMEPGVRVSDLRDLFTGGYDVCHIVPRGHSGDNGMGNLFIGTQHFNRQVQGDRTPYEALGEADQWPAIVRHVKAIRSMPLHKRNRLLAKERPEEFSGRHLATTGYISREVLKLAQRMVAEKQNAIVVQGRATGELRKFWEINHLVPLHPIEREAQEAYEAFLEKARKGEATEEDVRSVRVTGAKARSNFKHHALDALVVALTDRASLQALAAWMQLRDSQDPRWADRERRKLERARLMPDPQIQSKAASALENAVIVHRVRRTPSGQLHDQQPKAEGLKGVPYGEPWGTAIHENKWLIRYDHEGKPAQAYPLKSNHHCVIWESLMTNRKGKVDRCAEVVPTIEAVRRRNAKEPVIQKVGKVGYRFVMALVEGDVVLLTDGRLAQVRSFSPASRCAVDMELWIPEAARKLGERHVENPYFIKRITGVDALDALHSRVVLDPLGRVVYREGGRE